MDDQVKETILIIEDEESFRNIYRDMLESGNFNVLTAGDGEEGWQKALSEMPDLILLDLNLPKIHGFEVIKMLRSNGTTSSIPVIILSVLGGEENTKKGLELGASGYMVKGFCTTLDVLKKINVVLAKGHKHEPNKYRLALKERHMDGLVLERDIGLGMYYTCPGCRLEVCLELSMNMIENESHVFSARFICPKCRRHF